MIHILNVSLSCNLISLNEKHLDLAVLNKMLQEFGIKGNTISISKDSRGSIGLYSKIDGIEVPAANFESYGTIGFIQLLPLIINVLKKVDMEHLNIMILQI